MDFEEPIKKSRVDMAVERLYPKNEIENFLSHESSDEELVETNFHQKLAKTI